MNVQNLGGWGKRGELEGLELQKGNSMKQKVKENEGGYMSSDKLVKFVSMWRAKSK